MKKGTTAAMDRLTVALMARLEQAMVCERMRVARKEAGLTQDQLKDILGVHKHTIENVENNRLTNGPYQYINPWAEATGRSVEWLLHGRELVNAPNEDSLSALLERVADALERVEPFLPEQQPERGGPALPAQSH